ncbi:CLUMA_CG010985, isoform A [Clunio marinus]|uniref:Cleavage and polyadenylation specificity factor subunit 4 n=1 Tax=Clunio marinus TaxID=568069 RepID=A0A1J1IBD1_9DIPT|nr:CLUMA_CG010985, isoform A [Clunio marinus]
MEFIIANTDTSLFKIEYELNEQIGALPLPFSGMDKSTSAVCNFFNSGQCDKEFCPFRHIKAEQKTIVCKHWLRALSSDLSKEMPKRPPVCHYCGELGHKASFCPKLPPEQREAQLKADEMKYRQIALMKQQNPQYNHHLQQKIQGQLREQQENAGNEEHRDQSPLTQQSINTSQPPLSMPPPGFQQNHGPGHFHGHQNHQNHHQPRPPFQPRKLEDITCFKCGGKGHYANRCYSFLNNNFLNNKSG